MKTGRIADEHLILLSHEGIIKTVEETDQMLVHVLINFISYLRGLVPVYNTVSKRDMIEPLREKADGKTVVSMKTVFSKATLQVTSEVNRADY